jgi:hypothetical protein
VSLAFGASLEKAFINQFLSVFMSRYRTHDYKCDKTSELLAAALRISSKRTTISRHQRTSYVEERGTYRLTALGASTRGYFQPNVYQEHDFATEVPARCSEAKAQK